MSRVLVGPWLTAVAFRSHGHGGCSSHRIPFRRTDSDVCGCEPCAWFEADEPGQVSPAGPIHPRPPVLISSPLDANRCTTAARRVVLILNPMRSCGGA